MFCILFKYFLVTVTSTHLFFYHATHSRNDVDMETGISIEIEKGVRNLRSGNVEYFVYFSARS